MTFYTRDSVQRLVLPCPEAPPGSWMDAVTRALDLSVASEWVLDMAKEYGACFATATRTCPPGQDWRTFF